MHRPEQPWRRSIHSLTLAMPTPANEPLLGSLVSGFVLLVAALAALTVRRGTVPLHSAEGTRRALLYALMYGLCAACFGRVIGAALLGFEKSPWLFALGDVIFVTLALFVWVMVIAEGYKLSDYGFRGLPAARFLLTAMMGVGAVVVYGFDDYRALASGERIISADTLVFSLLFASAGSALPDEMLFRGYLMSTLDRRVSRWARVAIPALMFTLVRSFRFFPGIGVGTDEWIVYIVGVVLPLGLWWGLMRELAGGSLWPSLISHFLLEVGTTLARTSSPTA